MSTKAWLWYSVSGLCTNKFDNDAYDISSAINVSYVLYKFVLI